jgi:acyl-CoA synthetase (NDP forming)/GNAT superfamily N-acetyltransferase
MTVRNLDALFRGSPLVILGAAESPAQRQLLSNLESSLPPGQRAHLTAKPRLADLPSAGMAVVMRADWADAATIEALGARGCKALLWAADAPPGLEVLQAAKPHVMRLLGPRSAGLIHAGGQRNLSSLPLTPQPGSVALIAQSQSVAAAALDWAAGRGIGFSWLAVTGAEADVDAADLLDYAALDPQTRAVVLQVSTIRHARKFMSAARAAARLKPVLVLQTRRASAAGSGGPSGPDPVRSAAFQRAGLVECETLGGLFDGLTALELLPSVSGDRIAVVGNGSGVCALATDTVLRQGLQLAALSEHTRQLIAERVPQARFAGAAADLGNAAAADVLAVLRSVLADAGVSAALLIHSPMAGQPHQALAEAIADAALGERLLTVWLGLHSAAPARHSSAAARLATFASAEDAVRALRYRAQYRNTREMLGQTPPPDVPLSVDSAAIAQSLQRARAQGLSRLPADAALRLLTDYGLNGGAGGEAAAPKVRINAALHPQLGMVLSVSTEPASPSVAPAYGFAPLDELLALRMLDAAGCVGGGTPAAATKAMAAALIRLGQLVIDQPLIQRLDAVMAWTVGNKLVALPDCLVEIAEQVLPERERIALAPYPVALTHEAVLRGDCRYQVRAVRPADEPAMLRMLARLDPEEIRLRFFAYIRYFSHDMAARMTQVDYDRELTLVASSISGANAEPGEIAAMATLVADPGGRDAEYAVLVHHDHARRGLGRHLMECLLQIARRRGIGKVHGDVLADNTPMLGLVRSLGFAITPISDDPGCRRVEIVTAEAVAGEQGRPALARAV